MNETPARYGLTHPAALEPDPVIEAYKSYKHVKFVDKWRQARRVLGAAESFREGQEPFRTFLVEPDEDG